MNHHQHRPLDEKLLLAFLRNGGGFGQDDDHDHHLHPSKKPQVVMKRSDNRNQDENVEDGPIPSEFRADLERYSQDASQAIHELKVWMMDNLYSKQQQQQQHQQQTSNGDNSTRLSTTAVDVHRDDRFSLDDLEIHDDGSTTTLSSSFGEDDDIQSLCEELEMLDAMFSSNRIIPADPTIDEGTPRTPVPDEALAWSQFVSGQPPPPIMTIDTSTFAQRHLRMVNKAVRYFAAEPAKEQQQPQSFRTLQPLPRPPTKDTLQQQEHVIVMESAPNNTSSLSHRRRRRLYKLWKRLLRGRSWRRNKKQQHLQNDRDSVGDKRTPPDIDSTTWIPFVAPFLVQSLSSSLTSVDQGSITWCQMPRLISYFEVQINFNGNNNPWFERASNPSSNDDVAVDGAADPDTVPPEYCSNKNNNISVTRESPTESTQESDPDVVDHQRDATVAACIAVGMSTIDFVCESNLPGLDVHSCAYHSHDGSVRYNGENILRNTGLSSIQEYGEYRYPSFGLLSDCGVCDHHDTEVVVGCGIDYRTAQVFFTFNGKFLGYSSLCHKQLMAVDWYPTVGLQGALSSQHHSVSVKCNFGNERPFSYDLQSMIEIGKQVTTWTAETTISTRLMV